MAAKYSLQEKRNFFSLIITAKHWLLFLIPNARIFLNGFILNFPEEREKEREIEKKKEKRKKERKSRKLYL